MRHVALANTVIFALATGAGACGDGAADTADSADAGDSSGATSADPSSSSAGTSEDAGATETDGSTDTTDTTGNVVEPEPALVLTDAEVRYEPDLDALVFSVRVEGDAGAYAPTPAGQLDGAPVAGYVFPTTLSPAVAGFGQVEGTLALAVTSHPDFDDTPLWDEDGNAAYDDDGVVYHAHWVVLTEDDRAPAGLAVIQADSDSVLPPTAPMPMYLDSPGFTVIEDGSNLRVIVPADRVGRTLAFQTGALSAQMRVDASSDIPLLAVENIVSALDDGEAVMSVQAADEAPLSAWPANGSTDGALDISDAFATYLPEFDTWKFTMRLEGAAATEIPTPVGAVDGAPVVGYVFPTTLEPAVVGFQGIDGTVALAVTSHPDFDDTPFWDESGNLDYTDDGAVYHVHWVVLVGDEDSPAALSVPSQPDPAMLPPTAPMPMYLDSPGYHAFAEGNELHVLLPAWHLPGISQFNFDAVTARMRVDASGEAPVLRVEEVVEILSGDLSLPFEASQ